MPPTEWARISNESLIMLLPEEACIDRCAQIFNPCATSQRGLHCTLKTQYRIEFNNLM